MYDSPNLQRLQTTVKEAFQIKKKPFPWKRAFRAGLAVSLPIFVGLLLDNLQYGILASMGGYTALYISDQPYAQRARRIFLVNLGLTLSVIIGVLLAPYKLAASVVMGLIGALVIFIFRALQITGPSALFFLTAFAVATSMPGDLSFALLYGGLVFLGGTFSWVMSMLGWFIHPLGPETKAVQQVYMELANLVEAAGTERFDSARRELVSALKEAEAKLSASGSSQKYTDMRKRLILLDQHANHLYLDIVNWSLTSQEPLPSELGASIRALADSIGEREKDRVKIIQPEVIDSSVRSLFTKVYDADAIMNEPVEKIDQEVEISPISVKNIFLGAFDKNSIILLSAIRFGLFLMLAALFAYSFGFVRSYWIPLSCAAVMSGTTTVATLHRSIQRTIGTLIGLLIAAVIFLFSHNGYIIALVIFTFTFLKELFLVRNYLLALMFITPASLMIVEYSTHLSDFSFDATMRAIHITIGSMIGVIGVLVMGRRSASDLLNYLVAKTIRSQGQLMLLLFSEGNETIGYRESRERKEMQININNMLAVYRVAQGELFSKNEQLNALFPVIYTVEQLGYFLDTNMRFHEKRPVLPEKELAQLIYLFESMSLVVEKNIPRKVNWVPQVGYPYIYAEMIRLREVLNKRDLIASQH